MKSLVEEYFVLRTNAIQRKRFQNDEVYGYGDDESHVELLRDDNRIRNGSKGPPSFVGQSEALQYQMTRLEAKVKQLHQFHSRHLARPTLDDSGVEEEEIQGLTKEISQMFGECSQQLKSIRRHSQHCIGAEAIIVKNLSTYLSNRLQESTENFRKSQGEYLNKIKAREERSNRFFELDEVDPLTEALDRQWSKQDQLFVQDNSAFIQQREKEIQHIVQSISDLNVIFKELATMVTEQGTIIDRIDYNIEHTHIKVAEGLKQIKKAARYQKNDKKMHCIVILAVIVMIELLVLVFTKIRK